jgi:SAM-dependent methyltransferase
MDEARGQDTAFSDGEGDRYFDRNREVLAAYDARVDPVAQCIRLAAVRPSSILEIGAAAGDRVAALAAELGASGHAVDPSVAAVENGRARHPDIVMSVATMDELPDVGPFDLVVVNFVFHWVDRALLLRSMSEVDRMVADGGHLLIGDFLPAGHTKTPYHHRPGLWTFKQRYSDVFTASGLYCRVVELSGEYGGAGPSGDGDPAHRMTTCLLHKSLVGHYQTVTLD